MQSSSLDIVALADVTIDAIVIVAIAVTFAVAAVNDVVELLLSSLLILLLFLWRCC